MSDSTDDAENTEYPINRTYCQVPGHVGCGYLWPHECTDCRRKLSSVDAELTYIEEFE